MNAVAIVPVKISEPASRWMLREFKGKTPLEHTVLGLIGSGLYKDVIIAAADDVHSEYYAAIAKRSGAKLFLGEKDDINKRVKRALLEHRYDEGIAVRVNGENLFNLPSLAERVLDALKRGGGDYSFLSGLPNGLAPDAVSIQSLQKHGGMDEPYYRAFRSGACDLTVNKVDTGLDLEEVSFTALDYEADEFFDLVSTALPKADIDEFMEKAIGFYRDQLESVSIPQKRGINFKLNLMERGLKLERLYSMPVNLTLGISNLCNLKCVTCIQKFNKLSQEEFNREFGEGYKFWDISFDKRADGKYYKKSEELAPEAFDELEKMFFPFLSLCSFGLSGEPLLNKHLPDYIETAKKYGIDTHLITNGMIMDEAVSRRIAGGILDKVNVSFDGATRDTFEGIRKGSDFDRIKKNIRTLSDIRNRMQIRSPSINFATTISSVNFRELPDIVKIGGELGVDSVSAKYAITSPFMNREESLFWHMKETGELFEKAREQAEKSGIVVWLPTVGNTGTNRQVTCRILWETIIVRIGGMTTPCCQITRSEPLMKNGLQAIWNGDFYRKLRRGQSGKEPLIENCVNCSEEEMRDLSNLNSFIYTKESHSIY
jgi:MoaA/NifB/PqqE/SkfB family radical SAM enzyme